VIEDLDGTTVEPARRGHVLALSAATAAIAIVLLIALVLPPAPVSITPQGASPSPSARADSVMPNVWGPTTFSFGSGTTSHLDVNVKLVIECADGRRIDAPYYLVFEGNGQVMAVPLGASTARPVPVVVDRGSGRLTASCATSNVRVPSTNRRR
jgi:hypothetical protein